MTVKELRKLLFEVDDDLEVIMSKDGEGNGFSPFSDLGEAYYVADSKWSGDVYNEDDLEDCGIDKDEAKKCIVLWPTN